MAPILRSNAHRRSLPQRVGVSPTAIKTQTKAPSLDPTPPETNNHSSDNNDTGSQDPPSGDQGSSQSPPLGTTGLNFLTTVKATEAQTLPQHPIKCRLHSGSQSSPPSGEK